MKITAGAGGDALIVHFGDEPVVVSATAVGTNGRESHMVVLYRPDEEPQIIRFTSIPETLDGCRSDRDADRTSFTRLSDRAHVLHCMT